MLIEDDPPPFLSVWYSNPGTARVKDLCNTLFRLSGATRAAVRAGDFEALRATFRDAYASFDDVEAEERRILQILLGFFTEEGAIDIDENGHAILTRAPVVSVSPPRDGRGGAGTGAGGGS